ncbi:hypothetical protein GRS48_13975 [Halorubrum sp. JWXQ-INN 858]|uniref:hypothetical protein n=1 Tax=Halorubrum sp. JWXQ-INN 858 TaxID=2690782 RepID=UPI001357E88E|nr:hypothetical protein [Halorubrum sp. JWXQ-INN 858]MWV65918.1 hypothetical protein [Halorubrum sp. JWXQ-INN 858]
MNNLQLFVEGEQRYVRFAETVLNLNLADTQTRILGDVTQHKNTVIMSGNGVGKSYAVAVLNLAFLYCNPHGSVMMTSGSYAQMSDTVWSEMKSLLKDARERGFPLPGTMKESPPRIEFDDHPSKAFRAISTTNPGSLEGRHSEKMLVIVDEADKPEVGKKVIESARSSVTDDNDRFLVIGNPPRSEANSMYDLLAGDNYHSINFSSFDSNNVRVEAGLDDGAKIPGLVGLEQLHEDYALWNNDDLPDVEEAMSHVEADEDGILRPTKDGLDERWVRRRLGAIPDDGTESVRPFYANDVASAEGRWNGDDVVAPDYGAFGVDIARGGDDRTVVIGITDKRADVLVDVEAPGDHRVNKQLVEDAVNDTRVPVIIDAVGEGSGVADELDTKYNVTRFKGGSNAREPSKYYNQRSEALGKLGEWLDEGAIERGSDLASELRAASRHIEFTEKSTRSAQAWTATSKSELKKSDKMGRSPDLLDALSLAAWGMNAGSEENAGYGFFSY